MPTFNIYIPPVFLFIIITFLSLKTEAAPEYLEHYCPNTSTYSPNSTYQSNLNLVLSSLSSNATNENGFYNATAGRQDTVYGLFLCRGDVTADVCRDCVGTATSEILQKYCPKEKTAIIWYDLCLLRYDNQSFFSDMDYEPCVPLTNTQNVTEQSLLNQIVYDTINNISTRAASDQSGKKFATDEANFTAPYNTIYNLVQCTPDISAADCHRCLQTAVASLPNCCSGKQGGTVLLPSCNVRYEVHQFYSIAAPAPTPPVLIYPSSSSNTGNSSRRIIIIVAATVISVVIFSTFCFCFIRWKARKKDEGIKEENVENEITTVQSLQFELGTIEAATNNFSTDNKIGEGGFGSVYKGLLSNGQEIAVKRLSRGSGQGAQEFKNEVVLVAKLQHKNLVRLLGFCMGGEEKILIYEFMPNKSLDDFLFDPEKQAQLNWLRRYKIIGGIARAMLYLHEDSQLRIIHRDLKASNVLLDENMNPKISDFGLARIVGVDQTRGITNRIVGTYGYMSPEYVIRGHFSTKSDVFSFGVLVLEIISGKKNKSFYQSDYAENLLSYAWKHWRDGTPLELMDPTLTKSYSRNEVIRCIQIGLLCVQKDPADRPTMASIVLMLNSFSVSLPLPQQPAFFTHSRTESYMPVRELELDQSTSKSVPFSVNEASITELYPR